MSGAALYWMSRKLKLYSNHVQNTELKMINPFKPIAPKPPDYYCDISLKNIFFWIYLKEKCWLQTNQQLSFKDSF